MAYEGFKYWLDWENYLDHVEEYPVRSPLKPGQVMEKLAADPPEEGEPFEAIFQDFGEAILPGITHWQSPSFFAYFPSNNSGPSILGELLSAGLGVQGMLWATSPACTELETHVIDGVERRLDQELPDGVPDEVMLVVDAGTGQTRRLLHERDEAWVDAVDGWQWLDDGRRLLWVSDRDRAAPRGTGSFKAGGNYAGGLLGMQVLDRGPGQLAFRMDDRRQRLMATEEDGQALACIMTDGTSQRSRISTILSSSMR